MMNGDDKFLKVSNEIEQFAELGIKLNVRNRTPQSERDLTGATRKRRSSKMIPNPLGGD